MKREVQLTMPNYVKNALQLFKHMTPKRPQHAPSKWIPPKYGQREKIVESYPHEPPLGAYHTKILQQIIGKFLYYSREVDPTMLVALGNLATEKTKGTKNTLEASIQFVNYCATYPNAQLRYRASDMVLTVHSDASYLSVTHAKRRAGRYFYLGNKSANICNAPIHCEATILKNVMSSSVEAKVGALYLNAQQACPI